MITLCLAQPSTTNNIRNVIVESLSWDSSHINIYASNNLSTLYLVQLVPYISSRRPISAAQSMDADIVFIQQGL